MLKECQRNPMFHTRGLLLAEAVKVVKAQDCKEDNYEDILPASLELGTVLSGDC